MLAADDNYSGMSNYWSYPGQFSGYGLVSSLDFTGKVLLRNHTQLGNPVRFGLTSLNTNNGQQICGRGPMPFPNGADYSLWLLPTYVRQEDGHMRGILPGMLWMPQDRPYSDQTIVDNVVGQVGKRFLLVRTQNTCRTDAVACRIHPIAASMCGASIRVCKSVSASNIASRNSIGARRSSNAPTVPSPRSSFSSPR